MKNIKIKWGKFAYNLVAALVILTIGFGVSPVLAAGVAATTGIVLGFAPKSTLPAFYMAVQVEIWEKDIEEAIFKDNGFLANAFNADDYVLGGAVVHIPQSGGPGSVVKNRSSYPATIRTRTDTDVLYAIDEYTTDPVKIPFADNYELSYDKRQSVLGEDQNSLVQAAAEGMLYNWVTSPNDTTTVIPAGRILATTGAAVPASAPGATGNRKAYNINDLQALATKLRAENRWFEGKMNFLGSATAIAQMFPADSLTTATYMASVTEEERRNGLIARAQGFKIYSRSSVYVISTSGTIKAPGAATATTDNEACIAWYDQAVERAFGGVHMFAQENAPTEYGDVYSFIVRIGGRARRAGYEGIYLLQQAPSA